MNQEQYGRCLQAASIAENFRMRSNMTEDGNPTGAGGHPNRLPLKLLAAAKVLAAKKYLTASDLAYSLDVPRTQAYALLKRLERGGLAVSEIDNETRTRIFVFQHAAV